MAFHPMVSSATHHDEDLVPIRDRHGAEIDCRNRYVVYNYKPPTSIQSSGLFIEFLFFPFHNERIQSTNIPSIFSVIDTYLLWDGCAYGSELRAAPLTLSRVAVRFFFYRQPKQLSALVRTFKTQGSIIDAPGYMERCCCGPRPLLGRILRKHLAAAIHTFHKMFALVTERSGGTFTHHVSFSGVCSALLQAFAHAQSISRLNRCGGESASAVSQKNYMAATIRLISAFTSCFL
jgi:hypothetical protein